MVSIDSRASLSMGPYIGLIGQSEQIRYESAVPKEDLPEKPTEPIEYVGPKPRKRAYPPLISDEDLLSLFDPESFGCLLGTLLLVALVAVVAAWLYLNQGR